MKAIDAYAAFRAVILLLSCFAMLVYFHTASVPRDLLYASKFWKCVKYVCRFRTPNFEPMV